MAPPADDSMYVPGAPSIGGGEGIKLPSTAVTPTNAVTYQGSPVTYQGASITH